MYRDVMTTMKNFPAHNSANHLSDPSNLKFIVWAVTISIALILMSIALGVGIDPEVATFGSLTNPISDEGLENA